MCGIIGMVAHSPVNQAIYDGLTVLQHRGQDAAGIITCEGERLHLRKNNGLVRDVFRTRHMESLVGTMGIGHVRYPTVGLGDELDHRQSEPSSRAPGGVERLEDPLPLLLRDARAVVLDAQHHAVAVAQRRRAEVHRAAGLDGVGGVVDQVEEHLADLAHVAMHGGEVFRHRALELDALSAGQQGLAGERTGRERVPLDLLEAGVGENEWTAEGFVCPDADVDPDVLNTDSEGNFVTGYVELPVELDPNDERAREVMATIRPGRSSANGGGKQ